MMIPGFKTLTLTLIGPLQVPQFLADCGIVGKGQRVAISQPRRVGAIAACERVANERGGKVGDEVGYAIRFESNTCKDTRIKYMTDGVLLQVHVPGTQLLINVNHNSNLQP